MWLMASEIPIRLEILDQAGQRLFDTAARLKNLDDTFAQLVCDEPKSRSRLNWGAPVRFALEDGMRRYEITGAIVSRQEEESADRSVVNEPDDTCLPTWEMKVRLWECKLNVQRRSLPRRKIKFPVRFRVLCGDAADEAQEETTESVTAWCVDIGAGGIRLRTNSLSVVPARMIIEFGLPARIRARGVGSVHNFCLPARVIRAEPHGRHGDSVEMALKFERLSVQDGLMLNTLLC